MRFGPIKINSKIILIVVLLIASILRLWQIGNVPISPDWDEVALGYNAYSISHTGRDEYGKLFPVVLQSFNDFKPALYAYLVIPFINLFGLSVIAVRLPSAIFGIFAVYITYLLIKKLTNRQDYSLLTAFLLAISPWHIQFSRIGFEANVGLTCNLVSILCFLYALKKPKFLLLSFGIAAVSIYIYQSEKVFIPLLMGSLIVIWRKEFLSIPKKWILYAGITACLLLVPMLYYIYVTPDAFLRAKGVSIFYNNHDQLLEKSIERLTSDKQHNDIVGFLLDNRRVDYIKAVINGYATHFNVNWLFITGDLPRHHAPFMGLMYVVELPFLLIGIYRLVFSSLNRKIIYTIFAQFFITPIPASITFDIPNSVRTLNFLPTLQFFVALGIIQVYFIIRKIPGKILFVKVSTLAISSCLILFTLNFVYFLNQYFVQLNYYISKDWQYGYKEAISYIKPVMKNYKSIVVSNQVPLDQSYMFFLFYLKMDPSEYQKHGGTKSGEFKSSHSAIDNLTFRPLNWSQEKKSDDILYIGRPADFPTDAKVVKTIYYVNGEPAINIVKSL